MNEFLIYTQQSASLLIALRRRSRDLPDPVHCITTIYHICIDVSFQRVIIKIDERGILHEHL